ncbi:MAG: carboxypeptidase-like regulatory domain-containing protein, partial [Prevotella sp.]|nr:carboxypeptidase-like regulatory domain-containing protein [Prevotella sp.]
MNPARTTKLLKMTVTAILLLQLCMNTVAATPDGTLRQQMDMLHRRLGINFVYGQDIHVDRPYTGPALKGMQADAALKTLFRDTGISWQWKGSYIILKQHTSKEVEKTSPDGKAQVRGRRHTLSGYVRDREGEPLINATVYDLTSMQGTMTNEYGFFSITLAAGEHQLRVSYIGYSDSV